METSEIKCDNVVNDLHASHNFSLCNRMVVSVMEACAQAMTFLLQDPSATNSGDDSFAQLTGMVLLVSLDATA
jgi:hypothetical protein